MSTQNNMKETQHLGRQDNTMKYIILMGKTISGKRKLRVDIANQETKWKKNILTTYWDSMVSDTLSRQSDYVSSYLALSQLPL